MAQRRIEFHPEAVRDASEARLWYAERSGIAAERFVFELDQAVEQVMEAPDRWPRYVRD
jgi:plasmid stabilization system protein ParE